MEIRRDFYLEKPLFLHGQSRLHPNFQNIGTGFRTAWESLMEMPKAHPVKRHSLMRKTMNNIHSSK